LVVGGRAIQGKVVVCLQKLLCIVRGESVKGERGIREAFFGRHTDFYGQFGVFGVKPGYLWKYDGVYGKTRLHRKRCGVS